jgi:hypothetical protein
MKILPMGVFGVAPTIPCVVAYKTCYVLSDTIGYAGVNRSLLTWRI